MSKKTERDERVRKARLAQPAQRERTANPEAAPLAAPAPKKRRKPVPRLVFWPSVVVGLVVACSCLCGLISFIWPVLVPLPAPFMPALGATVQIVNPSPLSVYRVEYSCALQSVTDQSGFSVAAVEADPEKEQRSVLYKGNRADAQCQGRLNMQGVRPKSSESVVSISFVPAGWPFRRHLEYRVVADLDPIGNVRRWMVQ